MFPTLRGSLAQVRWAEIIRANAATRPKPWPEAFLALTRVNDATWYIGNRDITGKNLVAEPKPPELHQLEGGPPPPVKAARLAARPAPPPPPPPPRSAPRRASSPLTRRVYAPHQDPPEVLEAAAEPVDYRSALQEEDDDAPHVVERFADSVSQAPALAKITIMAVMSWKYPGREGEQLRDRARRLLESARERLRGQFTKDMQGIEQILGTVPPAISSPAPTEDDAAY